MIAEKRGARSALRGGAAHDEEVCRDDVQDPVRPLREEVRGTGRHGGDEEKAGVDGLDEVRRGEAGGAFDAPPFDRDGTGAGGGDEFLQLRLFVLDPGVRGLFPLEKLGRLGEGLVEDGEYPQDVDRLGGMPLGEEDGLLQGLARCVGEVDDDREFPERGPAPATAGGRGEARWGSHA